MSLYTRLAAGFLFPLHERLKRHSTGTFLRQMEASQWQTPEQLQAIQLRNLREFLGDIQRHVPYFRDQFRQLGFDPGAVRSVADLQALPLMDKQAIRAGSEAMKAENAGNLTRYNTGGSSGEPLVFYIGSRRVSHDVAAKWRATRWWGVDIGDPEIVIWGSPIELGAQDRIRLIRDKLLRTTLLPAFEMSEENLDGFVEAIRRQRPKMLFGYPSALTVIAGHARQRGIDVSGLGIKVAFVTSERLYEHQRETIESVFGCPVANGYGGRDAGFIAHQCPSGSMHLTAEDMVVEIVDEQGSVLPMGEAGEIVVTHMATNEFPFLRYRTGDVGVLGDERCACGRGLPVLREIQGRTTDFVIAQDGTVVHGLALIYVLRDMPGIAAFRIVQNSLDRTSVEIVRDSDYVAGNEAEIIRVFRQRLGETVSVDIEYLDEIRAEKSGKYRYVVSHVQR